MLDIRQRDPIRRGWEWCHQGVEPGYRIGDWGFIDVEGLSTSRRAVDTSGRLHYRQAGSFCKLAQGVRDSR